MLLKTDLMKKIKDVEVPPPYKLVSYDVSALFTSIPVDEAVRIIKKKLLADVTLTERCELSVDQLTILLDFCLNTTYFVCNEIFYRQVHGAPMGGPISPCLANLSMIDM